MRRDPELAHIVGEMPGIKEHKHYAIDKVTGLSLAIQMLSRVTSGEVTPLEEIALEERVSEIMIEASYQWLKYDKAKRVAYEKLLHEKSETQESLLHAGNELIKQHREDLDFLSEQRGIK